MRWASHVSSRWTDFHKGAPLLILPERRWWVMKVWAEPNTDSNSRRRRARGRKYRTKISSWCPVPQPCRANSSRPSRSFHMPHGDTPRMGSVGEERHPNESPPRVTKTSSVWRPASLKRVSTPFAAWATRCSWDAYDSKLSAYSIWTRGNPSRA